MAKWGTEMEELGRGLASEWRYKFMMRARPSPSSIVRGERGGERREGDCVWLSVARTRRERQRAEREGERKREEAGVWRQFWASCSSPSPQTGGALDGRGEGGGQRQAKVVSSPLLLRRHCTLDWSCSTLPPLLPRKQRPPDRHYIRTHVGEAEDVDVHYEALLLFALLRFALRSHDDMIHRNFKARVLSSSSRHKTRPRYTCGLECAEGKEVSLASELSGVTPSALARRVTVMTARRGFFLCVSHSAY